MRGCRNQDDIALRIAARMVIRANRHETGELPLRARVGLQRDGRESGDLRERLFELADHLRITLHLLERRERMYGGKLRPGNRDHLGRRIQLHRAGAKRNHRAVEPDVLALEALQITHHLRFRTMRREDRMGHERRLAREPGRERARRFGIRDARRRLPCCLREHGGYRQHVAKRRGFVDGDADVRAVEIPEIQAGTLGNRLDRDGRFADALRHLDPQRVEVRLVLLRVPQRLGGGFQRGREGVRLPGDGREPIRPVVHAIHRRDVREQRLRRADVRRRLLAPDVLLARLQRHAVREIAVRVDGHADDAAWSLPDECFARRQKRRVRSAIAHRHAEPLRASNDDVSAHLTWRHGNREGEQIAADRHEHVLFVRARR